jgi:acetyl esterase/lipase
MFETLEQTHYAAKDGGSITVTDRHDRSQLMAIVQFLVRRFRKQINSGEPKHEDGSIKLDPPQSKLRGCTLSQRTVEDIYLYDITASLKKLPEKGKKRIYYFAGSSWQMAPSGQHWSLCAKLATDMPDTIVTMVSPPMAPNNPAPSSFPWMMRLYRTLMAEAQEAGDKVILAGDSSGANIILCLTLEALREDAERGMDVSSAATSNAHPVALMAISPSTDLTRNNPDIDRIAHHDPLLTPAIIKQTAGAWTGDWNPAERRVSPINADISLLAKRGIKVHGVTAGCDVLAPDGVMFRNKLSEYNVQGEWLHWEKQMHCFVLTLPYGLREAREGVEWIINLLKKV